MNNMETYLAHSGILGMKWGVRRYQYKDGSLTPEGRKRYGSGNSTKIISNNKSKPEPETTKRRNVKDMSDEELRREVNRLQLERSYTQLTTPANVDAGQTVAQKALKKIGDSFVSTLAQKSGEAIAKKIVKSVFGEEDNKKNKN